MHTKIRDFNDKVVNTCFLKLDLQSQAHGFWTYTLPDDLPEFVDIWTRLHFILLTGHYLYIETKMKEENQMPALKSTRYHVNDWPKTSHT